MERLQWVFAGVTGCQTVCDQKYRGKNATLQLQAPTSRFLPHSFPNISTQLPSALYYRCGLWTSPINKELSRPTESQALPDLLDQQLHFQEIPRCLQSALTFKKFCLRKEDLLAWFAGLASYQIPIYYICPHLPRFVPRITEGRD